MRFGVVVLWVVSCVAFGVLLGCVVFPDCEFGGWCLIVLL